MKRLILMACMLLAVLGAHAEWMAFGESIDGDVWYIDSEVENGRYSGQYVVWVKIKLKKGEVVKGRRIATQKVCYIFRDGCSQFGVIAVHLYDARDRTIDNYDTEYPDWEYPIPDTMGVLLRDLLRDRLKTGHWNIDYTPDEEETPDTSQTLSEDVKVWVCSGGSSTTYHSRKDCRGLRRCSRSVVQMSAVSAEEKGKRACKLCY